MSEPVKTTGQLVESSQPKSLLLRLKDTLSSCSKSIEAGETSFPELVVFLDSVSKAALSDPTNEDAKAGALLVLSEILNFLSIPSLDQVLIDVLSFELPVVVSKLAAVSDNCMGIVDEIIECLVRKCNPRDMLSILCEALDLSSEMTCPTAYAAPLSSGLAKVIISIKRRHFEQLKVAVPVTLNVLKALCLELDDGDIQRVNLFQRALGIAESIKAMSGKLVGSVNENLRSLLGLYTLQLMALFSLCMGSNISYCLPLVLRLSSLLPYCHFSYAAFIYTPDLNISVLITEEEDYFRSCFCYIKLGASISVIWGHISEEVAQSATENMLLLKDELQRNKINRWQAVGMLNHVLSSVNLPWELKEQAIDFLLCITEGVERNYDELIDFSSYMLILCAALQAITKIIMYAPNTVLRKKAFEALKRVLADIPVSERVDILRGLIIHSNSSSMIALLLDLVRGELHKESCQRLSAETEGGSIPSQWTADVLELVELVLRPPKGGPPSFPDDGEAVLAALNLYRFLVMTESASKMPTRIFVIDYTRHYLVGKTNYTGVLFKSTLQKAYSDWFLPLRTLVAAIREEDKSDCDEFDNDTVCALNPVELVLYHCLELVEEKLRQPM